jgi:hypothetical protein
MDVVRHNGSNNLDTETHRESNVIVATHMVHEPIAAGRTAQPAAPAASPRFSFAALVERPRAANTETRGGVVGAHAANSMSIPVEVGREAVSRGSDIRPARALRNADERSQNDSLVTPAERERRA